MLLAFPNLHPELWPGKSLEGLRFFDPGLAAEPFADGFRPDGLPLDPKTAAALINDCINFGEQFKDPAEMAWFGAQSADDFYEGSSMSIQAQLTRQFDDGQGSKRQRELKEARAKAQFVLLLAWFLEERMMELAGLESGIRSGWRNMDTTLGVDDDDRLENGVVMLGAAESHTGGASDGRSIPFPWKRVAEALPGFIPEDALLLCADPGVIAAWEEQGIEFVEEREGYMTATRPAWQFACRRRAPEGMPLALMDLTVAVIK
ncbi:MAG: hypothetical protein H0S80_02160 [Desulfovibrionaceae bacterium]|nr:hypothetical protein [Desulfovibrionaceae bacterium]